MKRFRFAVLSLVLAAPLGAQRGDTLRQPIDRVVAVVGTTPILLSEAQEVVNQRRAQGMVIPPDSAGQAVLLAQVVSDLVDEEVLVQRAQTDTSIKVADADLTATVDQQLKQVRSQFQGDQELLSELRTAGFGNLEEYRRWLTDQARRRALQQRLVQQLQREGKMPAASISEKDISDAYEKSKEQLPKRPASVMFRQIVVATTASQAALDAARAKADSLLAEIRAGGDFEQIARRESMDPSSKEQGGDLGWNRRGHMVEPFDRVMFALAPGKVSPVIQTTYGFHIIRVDRVRPDEVKARHILIRPSYDSADVARARVRADSVLTLWQAGTPFDSLVKKFHDPDEVEGSLDPFPRDSLPESYAKAFEGKKTGDFVSPFSIDDPQRGVPKFVIARMTNVSEGGDYTIADLRERIRENLSQERSYRQLIDQLKQETYVRIQLEGVADYRPK